jgi:hypothetical protein
MTETVRALACPNCGAPIEVRAVGYSVTIVCGNCGSSLDAADPALGIIRQSVAAMARPAIVLGTRGSIDDVEWEVIGYLERSSDDDSWKEYLLFNPYAGYRFLIDDGEAWWLAEVIDKTPIAVDRTATLDGEDYHGVARYAAKVDFVVGEFYWRVTVGETVRIADYRRRTTTLSNETSETESSWSRANRRNGDFIRRAFGLKTPAPGRSTFTPGRKARAGGGLLESLMVAGVAVAALLLVMVTAPSAQPSLTKTMQVEPAVKTTTQVIGTLQLPRTSSAVKIEASASLDNSWVDLDYALVNRVTQQRIEASGIAEYYRGQDSDGNWSEGNSQPETFFASVPAGSYDVLVEATASNWQPANSFEAPDVFHPPVSVTISVSRNAVFRGNFWLALIAIAIWPAWLYFRRRLEKDLRTSADGW